MSAIEPGAPGTFAKADKLRLAALVVMVGFTVSVVVHYWYSAYCGYRYPYSTYLFRPGDTMNIDTIVTERHAFGDLLAVCIHAENREPYATTIPTSFDKPGFFPSNYFPFGAMISYPLTLLPYPWAVAVFLTGFVGILAAFNTAFMRTGRPLADALPIAALTLMNYPAQFVCDRGNIEGIVFAFLAGFTLLVVRRRPAGAALCLAAAIAMKAVPAVFLPLCARTGGRRAVGIAMAAAAGLTLAALLAMRPPVLDSLRQLLAVLVFYSRSVTVGLDPTIRSSSLYGLFCTGAWFLAPYPTLALVFHALLYHYSAITAVILGVSLVACALLPLKLWESATVAVVCLVALPTASSDYRLIHVMIPFALFLNSRSARSAGIVTTVLFSLLLIPKSFVVIGHEATLNGVLNPLILMTLLGAVLRAGWRRRRGRGPRRRSPCSTPTA